jgi:cell division protein FtsB
MSGAYPHRSSLSQQRSRTASITRPEELESIKRENEMLRRRVRELELTVRKLREGAAPRDEQSDGGGVPSGAGQGNAS